MSRDDFAQAFCMTEELLRTLPVFGLIPTGDEYQLARINALWLDALPTEETLGLSHS
jgi:hypothetical protein